jgi:hypothetical protein
MLTSKDSLNYRMLFWHHDKIHSDVIINKKELSKSELINLKCNNIRFYKNLYKEVAKQYDYIYTRDTIVNKKKYSAYKFKSNLKLRKRKNIGTNIYIIDEYSSFHLPILIHPTEFEKWINIKSIPSGIYIEKKHISADGEAHSSEKLINFVGIDKRIVIPKDCEKLD